MSRIDPRLAALARTPVRRTTLRPATTAIMPVAVVASETAMTAGASLPGMDALEPSPEPVAVEPPRPAPAPARKPAEKPRPKPRTAAEKAADDRRNNGRKSQIVPAAIAWRGLKQPPLQSVVKDMSMTGVRLQMPPKKLGVICSTGDVPDRFILLLRTEQIQYECEVAWRNGTQLGARFLGPSRPLAAEFKTKRGW